MSASDAISYLKELTVKELQQVIKDEGLKVKKNIGGNKHRTKEDIISDIQQARAQLPNNVLASASASNHSDNYSSNTQVEDKRQASSVAALHVPALSAHEKELKSSSLEVTIDDKRLPMSIQVGEPQQCPKEQTGQLERVEKQSKEADVVVAQNVSAELQRDQCPDPKSSTSSRSSTGHCSQARVATGASGEEIAAAAYGVPFRGLARRGEPDVTLLDGSTIEIKNVDRTRCIAMEITASESGPPTYGKEIRAKANDSKERWGQKTIPNPLVRELIKEFTHANGTHPVSYANAIKEWYVRKASLFAVVIDGECYQIPTDSVQIRKNDNDATAFGSYGSGARIKVVGLLPDDYQRYRVEGGQVTGTPPSS